MTLAWMVLAVLVLLLLRVPVAFALLLPCLIYVLLSDGITLAVALQQFTGGLDSFPLLAVPLFIMTGYLANAVGITDRLFAFLMSLLGGVRGSLGYVNVTSSVVFSWMSGAAIADAAGLGSVLVPEMRKRGYEAGFSLGLTGASSMIGPVMPPSIPAIIYAVTAGVSVGAMFFAGVVPALILALVLCGYVAWYARGRNDLASERVTGRQMLSTTVAAVPVLVTPAIILGGILGGVFTPTEAAAAAVMWMLFLGCVYRLMVLLHHRTGWSGVWVLLGGVDRALTPGGLGRVLVQTARTTGAIMIIVAAAALFGWVIAREQGPRIVSDAILRFTDNPFVFLLLVNICLLLLGMLLEPVAALLISVPVLLPVAEPLGVDPLHLGVVMILNLVVGLLTPPVGLVLYVLSAVTNAPFPQVVRGVLPFLVLLVFVLILVTFIPAISLALPRLLDLG